MRYLLKITISILLFSVNSYGQFIPFPFTSHSTGTREARTFYVKNSGSDAATGLDTTNAWQTISKVNSTTFIAGDTIKFKGGNTFTGTIRIQDDTGTVSQPIVFTSYGGSRATISAQTDSNGIYCLNLGNIVIRALTIRSTFNPFIQAGATRNNISGIFFFNGVNGQKSNVVIDSCYISRFNTQAIMLYSYNSDSTKKGGYKNVDITNCTIDSIGDKGIHVVFYLGGVRNWYGYGGYPNEDININWTTIARVTGLVTGGTYTGIGILYSDLDTGTISNCVISNCGTAATGYGAGSGGIDAVRSNKLTVQFNEVYNQYTGGYDGGGIHGDVGVTNSTYQYNYCHDNEGSGISLFGYNDGYPRSDSNNTIRYNICQNNGKQGSLGSADISVIGGNTLYLAKIYNNTVYTTSNHSDTVTNGIWTGGTLTNVYVWNNIMVTGDAISRQLTIGAGGTYTNLAVQGNLYWGYNGTFLVSDNGTTYTSLNYWQAANSKELLSGVSVARFGNPQLNNAGGGGTIGNTVYLDTMTAYKTTGASLTKDMGLNIDSLFGINAGTRDYFGTALRQNDRFDIGAYENPDSYVWQDTTKMFICKSLIPPVIAKQYLFDTLIMKFQTDSLMRDARIILPFASPDTNLALRNIKIDSIQAIRNGTMTFMVDSGFYGNGTTGFIKTQVNASTQSYGIYSVNDISTGLYVISNVGEAGTDIGCYATNFLYFRIRNASNINSWYVNATTGSANGGKTDSRGLWVISRNGSGTTSSYIHKNGVLANTSTAAASTGIPSAVIYIGNVNYGGELTTKKYSFYWLGRNLSTYRHSKLSEHINWFMTRLGINQY